MPVSDNIILTGYYRYTDIFYEWEHVLVDPERALVKATLAHDALTHPDHPLHPGRQGIDMYLGTFQNAEARLLFSSKQVDYIRYWLHAMKLTKEIIPLPYSDCLLLEKDLQYVSPVTYIDGGSLRSALKDIDRNNRRLKGTNPTLSHRRYLFERIRTFWREKKGIFCAVDFEAWERDHTLITEFGWSFIRFDPDGQPIEGKGHLIAEEARGYVNSAFVKDCRYNYNFGQSMTLKRKAFKAKIHALFEEIKEHQPVFLVFHDNNQDIKYLNQLEVDLTGKTDFIPDSKIENGFFVVDTADLIGALMGESGNKRSLSQTCNLLQVPSENLHNAGNDAHYTLLALRSMAEGDQLDMQREQRWPNQTTTGVQVEVEPWQEDDDYSDEEGIFGFIPPNQNVTMEQGKDADKEMPVDLV